MDAFRTFYSKSLLAGTLDLRDVLPVASSPRVAMEILVYRMTQFSKAFSDQIEGMDIYFTERSKRYDGLLAKLVQSVENLPKATMPLLSAVDPLAPPTAGDVRAFRDKMEAQYRAVKKGGDVRKSDSVTGSGFAMSHSSVPYKTHVCLKILRRWGEDLAPDAVAFGTSSENHWEKELLIASPDVSFYDLEFSGVTNCGSKVSLMDIFAMPGGWQEGGTLYDDSCPPDPLAKLSVIQGAGFRNGFIKLMMGWGSDQKIPTTTLPPQIQEFMKCYSVEFIRVSPHSEEYFLVFAKRSDLYSSNWSAPLIVPDVGDEIDEDVARATLLRRAATWRRVRCLEIYKFGIARSVAAFGGNPGSSYILPFKMYLPHPDVIHGSGHVVPAKLVKGSLLRVVAGSEDVSSLDF